MKKAIFKKPLLWIVIGVVLYLIIILTTNISNSRSFHSLNEPSTAPASAMPSEAPIGVNPDKFASAVNEYISDLNNENNLIGDYTVEISVTHIIGFVDIYLTDLTVWSSFTETDKRDLINTLGKAMDELAISSTYPGTLPKCGSDTTLHSPSGQELIERTSLGIIKFY